MAKLKRISVAYISLVKNPANKREIVFKSADSRFTDEKDVKITKSTAEGLVYGTVYEPGVKDAQGDWADKEAIQKACHEFLEKGGTANIDTEHNEQKSGARVVESSIGDNGAWNVVLKMDPNSETFKKVQKGEVKGLSMGAFCEKSDEEPPVGKGGNDGEVIKTLKAVQESVEKISNRLEKIEKGVDSVPKSRQLRIDGDKVRVEKSEDGADFSEFNFNGLAD